MKRLEMTVAAIRQRFGPRAVRRLGERASPREISHVPTGFPALDDALGIGGVPRGRVTELLAAPTSGVATLALKLVANAQGEGDTAGWVDLSYTLDPDWAYRCGVSLDRLLVVRPHSGKEGLDIAHSLVAGGGVGVLIFDSTTRLLGETVCQCSPGTPGGPAGRRYVGPIR